jgi:regulator of protease activity HflC (stomatin/prohibitin superfamily)
LVLDWGTREPPASAFKIEAPSVQDITPIADLRKAMRLVVAKKQTARVDPGRKQRRRNEV